MLDRHAVQEALNAGHGILRLEPCWVNDRRNLVASSPKRFDQRASISGIRSGQILTAASPLAVSRTGQSARMPRPLPKPARFPAASATTPHRSRQPSPAVSAREASVRTETGPSAKNRSTFSQSTSERRALRLCISSTRRSNSQSSPTICERRAESGLCGAGIIHSQVYRGPDLRIAFNRRTVHGRPAR